MNSKKKFYKGGHAFFLEDPKAWEDIINFFKDQYLDFKNRIKAIEYSTAAKIIKV